MRLEAAVEERTRLLTDTASELAAKTQPREEVRSAEMFRPQSWAMRPPSILGGAADPTAALRDMWPQLLNFVAATGVAVFIGGKANSFGRAPDAAYIARLAEWVGSSHTGRAFATDRLPEQLAGCTEDAPSGLLAVPTSRQPGDYVMWFRSKYIRTVTWAGDPTKAVTVGPSGARLTPRGSCAAWATTVRGQSEPRSAVEVEAAQAVGLSLLVFAPRGVTASEAGGEEQRQSRVSDEIASRVLEAVTIARSADEQVRHLVATLQASADGLTRR